MKNLESESRCVLLRCLGIYFNICSYTFNLKTNSPLLLFAKFNEMNSQSMDQKLRSKINDQLAYFNQIEEKSKSHEHATIFLEFCDILCKMKTNTGKEYTLAAVGKLAKFLKRDYNMLEGFNAFLPFNVGIRIEERHLEPVLINVNFEQSIFPDADELNREFSKVIEHTEEFIARVYECFLKYGFNFNAFMKIILRYREKKSNPNEEMMADEVLRSDLVKLFKKRKDLLMKFHQLRIPDYLSIISFHYIPAPTCMLVRGKLRAQINLFKGALHKVVAHFKTQPVHKVSTVLDIYMKTKLNNSETINCIQDSNQFCKLCMLANSQPIGEGEWKYRYLELRCLCAIFCLVLFDVTYTSKEYYWIPDKDEKTKKPIQNA